MARKWTARRRRWKTAFFLLGLCMALFAFVIYRYMAFNLWLYRDARSLQPYDVILVENGEDIHPSQEALNDSDLLSIEKALVEKNAPQRLVVHLSRSDVRYSLLGRRASVKIFLETSVPGEPDRVQRIKFLNTLKHEDSGWIILPQGIVQLTIP